MPSCLHRVMRMLPLFTEPYHCIKNRHLGLLSLGHISVVNTAVAAHVAVDRNATQHSDYVGHVRCFVMKKMRTHRSWVKLNWVNKVKIRAFDLFYT